MIKTKEEAIQVLLKLTSYCNEAWLYTGINALLGDLEKANDKTDYIIHCNYFKNKTDDKWVLDKIEEVQHYFETK